MKLNIPALLRRLLPTRHLSGVRFSRRDRRRLFRTEPLEVRTLLAGVSDADGTLRIELEHREFLQLSAQEDGYHLKLRQGVFNDTGLSASTAFEGLGSDTLIWTDLAAFDALEVSDIGDHASVAFENSVTAYQHPITVDLDNLVHDLPRVSFGGSSDFGNFPVRIETEGIVSLQTASVRVHHADFSVNANSLNTAQSLEGGITLRKSSIEASGSGNISLVGRAPQSSGSAGSQGIRIVDSALVANRGRVQLEGKGGLSLDWNVGVSIGHSKIETSFGDVEITGDTSDSNGANNKGVVIHDSEILAPRTDGPDTPGASIRIFGDSHSNSERSGKFGVSLERSTVSVVTHEVIIEGAAGNSAGAIGVEISGSAIESLGESSDAGRLQLRGTTAAQSQTAGIRGDSGRIRTAAADLRIYGQAPKNQRGTAGIFLALSLETTSQSSDQGHVSIHGEGDNAVLLSTVSTHAGDISIDGDGTEHGVWFRSSTSESAIETVTGNIIVAGAGYESIQVDNRLLTQRGSIEFQETGGINAAAGIMITAALEAPAGNIRLNSDKAIVARDAVIRAGNAIEVAGVSAVDGQTSQANRISLSQSHLETVSAATSQGIRVAGQFVWLTDSVFRSAAGDIEMNGVRTDAEYGGLLLARTVLETTTGHVWLNGASEVGVNLRDIHIQTSTGEIRVEGRGQNTPTSLGIDFNDGSIVSGSGDVTFFGHGGGEDSMTSIGVRTGWSQPSVTTRGNIVIKGQTNRADSQRGLFLTHSLRINAPNPDSIVELQSDTAFIVNGYPDDPVFLGTGNLILKSTMDTTELSLWAPTTGHLIDRTILQAIAPGWNQVNIKGSEHARIKIGSVPFNSPLKLFGDADFNPNAQLHAVIGSSTQTLLTVTGQADIPAGVQLIVSQDPDWSPVEGSVLQILERQSGTGTFDGWTDGVVRNELFDSVVSEPGSDGSTVSVQIPDSHIFVTPDRFQTNHPTFRWSVAPTANSWDVWLAAAGSREAIVDTNLDTPFLTMSEDLPLGQYFLYVRPVTADGRRLAWQAQALSVDVSPMASASISSAGLITTWQQVPGATHYRVVIQDLARGSAVVDITTAELTHHFERSFGRFRVWVRAVNERGYSSTWTDPISLARGPQLVNSTFATFVPRPAFTWHKPEEAATYRIWIEHAGSVILNQAGINESQYQIPFDLASGTYRWWVQPTSIDGTTGAWSQRGTLYVGGRTEIETIDFNPRKVVSTVRWLPVEGASAYEVFARSPIGKVVRAVVAADGELSYRFAVPEFVTYRFWVRAQNVDNQWGPWTNVVEFYKPAPTHPSRPSFPAETATAVPGEAASISLTPQEGVTYHYVITNRGAITTEGTVDDNFLLVPEYGEDQAVYIVAETADGSTSHPSALITINYDGKSKVTWPAGNISKTVSIAWTPVTGPAIRYQLQVQHVESGTVVINDETTDDSYHPEELIPGTYRAWVRVLADGFTGPWSAAHEFTVG